MVDSVEKADFGGPPTLWPKDRLSISADQDDEARDGTKDRCGKSDIMKNRFVRDVTTHQLDSKEHEDRVIHYEAGDVESFFVFH